MNGWLSIVSLLWITVPFTQLQVVPNCPQYCSCFVWQNMKKAECVQKNIVSADVAVPKVTEVLDLAVNVISTLSSDQFRAQGLTSLMILNLSRNHIKHIDMNSFQGLSELRYIDLSHNHIYYILPITFDDLHKLRVLNLSSNKLREWTTNLRIPSLQVLDISNCELNSISNEVFIDLPRLSSLLLSDNKLHRLKVDLFIPLNNLKEVVLSSNPWICDEEISKLKAWFNSISTNFKGLCEVTQQNEINSDKFERMIQKPPNTLTYDISNILDENEDVELTTSLVDKGCTCPSVKSSVLQVPLFDSIPSFWAFVIGFQLCAVICIMSIMVWQRTCCKRQMYRNTDILLSETILSTESSCSWDRNGMETPPPAYRSIFRT